MRKIICTVFITLMALVAFLSLTASAAPVDVTVVADESWGTATYDSATALLRNVIETDVDGEPVDVGYAFKITGMNAANGTATLLQNGQQASEKIVIPYSFTYNEVIYRITDMQAYILGPSSNTAVQEVVVSEGITALGSGGTNRAETFRNAKALTTITLPSTLLSMPGNAFMGCTALQSIVIPEGVKTIPGNGFNACSSLTTVTFNGNNIATIGANAFSGCSKLATINNFPDSIATIGASAFFQCGAITELVIPQGVTTINNGTFGTTSKLVSLTFEGNITSFGADVFKYTQVQNIIFKGDIAPSTFGTMGRYDGGKLTVYYPASGTGYDGAIRSYFPASTVYIPVGTGCKISTITPTQDGYQVDFSISLAEDIESSVQVVAIYSDDSLIAAKTVDSTDTSVLFTTDETITRAKAFIWGGFPNIKPLCSSSEKQML